MKTKLYFYKAQVISVYDGDTCTVDIDLGMGIWNRKEKLRFYRINTPEIRGDEREEGIRSRDFLRALIDGKEVWLETENNNWINVNDKLVEEGFAEYKDY